MCCENPDDNQNDDDISSDDNPSENDIQITVDSKSVYFEKVSFYFTLIIQLLF